MITTPEGQMYRRNRRHIRRFLGEVEPDDAGDTFTQEGDVQEGVLDTLPESDTVGGGTPPENSTPSIPEQIPTAPTLRRSSRSVSKPK